jgi:hypothetical protein
VLVLRVRTVVVVLLVLLVLPTLAVTIVPVFFRGH